MDEIVSLIMTSTSNKNECRVEHHKHIAANYLKVNYDHLLRRVFSFTTECLIIINSQVK